MQARPSKHPYILLLSILCENSDLSISVPHPKLGSQATLSYVNSFPSKDFVPKVWISSKNCLNNKTEREMRERGVGGRENLRERGVGEFIPVSETETERQRQYRHSNREAHS